MGANSVELAMWRNRYKPHQRCVMYVLSYVSVVDDFLQTIIWTSLFAAICAG